MDKAITVRCYAGFKADERPTSFSLEERTLEVRDIVDRWYDVDANYFKVETDDGSDYPLKHDLNADRWLLVLPDQKG